MRLKAVCFVPVCIFAFSYHLISLSVIRKEIAAICCCLFRSLFDSNCYSNGHTNHGVVTCADETHHLYVNMTAVEENALIVRRILIIEHITHLICQPHYIIFYDVCQDVDGSKF